MDSHAELMRYGMQVLHYMYGHRQRLCSALPQADFVVQELDRTLLALNEQSAISLKRPVEGLRRRNTLFHYKIPSTETHNFSVVTI